METDKIIKFWTERNNELDNGVRYSTYILKKEILDKLDVKNKKVIDIGCGYGTLVNYLNKRGAKAEGLEICRDIKNNNIKIIYGDCRDMPIDDNEYDIVMSFGTIEHVKEWKKAVKEHFRICKPNGKVIIMVPYIFSPCYYAMLLYFLRGVIKHGITSSAGNGFRKKVIKEEMQKYGSIIDGKIFDFCCLLEGFTKKGHFKLADFLEKYFGFMGFMIYYKAEKSATPPNKEGKYLLPK